MPLLCLLCQALLRAREICVTGASYIYTQLLSFAAKHFLSRRMCCRTDPLIRQLREWASHRRQFASKRRSLFYGAAGSVGRAVRMININARGQIAAATGRMLMLIATGPMRGI